MGSSSVPKFWIEETTLHHARYEVEADTREEAERKHLDFNSQQVEEFWGEVTREIKQDDPERERVKEYRRIHGHFPGEVKS